MLQRSMKGLSMEETQALPAGFQLSLALQGGGSHGAFGWGVLHELLESEALEIEAISGTSAGAINAVIYADGWLNDPEDRRRSAQEALGRFWHMTMMGSGAVLRPHPWDALQRNPTLRNNPLFTWVDLASRLFSQYELGIDVNPLLYLLESAYGLDATRLRDPAAPLLFLTATDVATGEAVIFDNSELTLNAVLASACLPSFVRAINIKGRPMWDGGYSGNPALWPLVRHTSVDDILIVQVDPVDIDATPQTALEIINRINEITFNSSLLAETRALERLNDLHLVIDEICAGLRELEPDARGKIMGRLVRRMQATDAARERTRRLRGLAHRWRLPQALGDLLAAQQDGERLDTRQFEAHPLRPVALHIIHGDDALDRFDATSKFNTSPEFLSELFELGRTKAREWVERRLPVAMANRLAGTPVSTFSPESGLSGR
jgi:NTE family protein